MRAIDGDELIEKIYPFVSFGSVDYSELKRIVKSMPTIQTEQRWIPIKERNPIEYDNPIEFMATLEDPSGERYVEFIEWDGYEWDDFYTDDNERGVWGYDKVIAWMKKPEPWEGEENV